MPSRRLVYTALHQAILECRVSQVKILLEKCDSDVDSKDVFGRTPMMLCSLLDNSKVRLKMATLLRSANPFMDAKDNLGRTALAYACIYGRTELVEVMCREQVVDSTEPDNDGNTPLHHSAVEGSWSNISFLIDVCLESCGNIDCRNHLGYSPLMFACQHRNYKAALILLLSGGASGFIRDNVYFFNALEWIEKAELLEKRRVELSLRRSTTAVEPRRSVFLTERSETAAEPHFYREITTLSLKEGLSNLPQLNRGKTVIGNTDMRQSLDDLSSLQRSRAPSMFSKRSRATTTSSCRTQFTDASGVTIYLNVDTMSPHSSKQMLIERLKFQAYHAASSSLTQPKRAILPRSRPQTSDFRRLCPNLSRSEKENTCRLLGMFHASHNSPKSASVIRQETGYSDGGRLGLSEGDHNRSNEMQFDRQHSGRRVSFAPVRTPKK